METLERIEYLEKRARKARTLNWQLLQAIETLQDSAREFGDYPDGLMLTPCANAVAEDISGVMAGMECARGSLDELIERIEDQLEPLYDHAREMSADDTRQCEHEYRQMAG